MKFSKLGLLTLLISLFILNGCKNQDGIGLGVDDNSQLNGSILVDTSMTVTTMPEDTVVTTSLARSPLSYFKDPEFGTTESNIAVGLSLPGGSAYTVPAGEVIIDSAILVLPYASGFYGDSLTSRFTANVHQLSERINVQPYYNNKEWGRGTTIIGTKSFLARPNDTLRVLSILKGRPDTFIRVSPQIRVPINPSFFDANLFLAPASWRASNNAFQAGIRGLYITLDKNQTTGPGGNIMLSMDSARVSIYYRAVSGTTTDTALVTLPVLGRLHAANIKHTYSTKVQAAMNTPAADGNFYLQGLAGLRAKVTFPNIKNIFAGVGNVVLNRAELIVKAAPGTEIPYRVAQKLTLYQFDLAKQRTRLQDALPGDPRAQNGPLAFGGYYNKATGEYHFTVTGYIQDLLQGKAVDYGTFLAPVDGIVNTQTVDIAPTAQYAERTIAVGKNSPYRIKLNITYTKLNQ